MSEFKRDAPKGFYKKKLAEYDNIVNGGRFTDDDVKFAVRAFGREGYDGERYLRTPHEGSFWNGYIEGIRVDKHGKMSLNVYWQGDSTDGNDSIPYSSRGGSLAPEWSGGRQRRSRVNISADDVAKAVRSGIKHGVAKFRQDHAETIRQ